VAGRLMQPPLKVTSQWQTVPLVIHTNQDALHIYLTRKDPVTGVYQNVRVQAGELLDEHGCRFIPTQATGTDYGLTLPPMPAGGFRVEPSTITCLTFESWPRRQQQFRLRVFDKLSHDMAEFSVNNPARIPPAPEDDAIKPLPVRLAKSNLTYILTACGLRTNAESPAFSAHNFQNPVQVVPEFDVLENGQTARDWKVTDLELRDGAGNFSPKNYVGALFLCPREPVWRLKAQFMMGDRSRSELNETWTLTNVTVPGRGKTVAFRATNQVAGVFLQVASIGAIGTGGLRLFMPIARLPDDRQLTAWATDSTGRRFTARGSDKQSDVSLISLKSSPTSFIFDLPAETGEVDVTFCVHRLQTVEFVFKPPQPGDRK